jgi:hypothetical protein
MSLRLADRCEANPMTTNRKIAIAVGVLFFTATISYGVGNALIASALEAQDDLSSPNIAQIRIGVLLEFINSAAVVGIGVLLFPILRRYSEGMALGYAGSRIIESVLLLMGALSALLLLTLRWYDLAFQMAMIALGAGSLLLCYILYKNRLVPRVISVLGFVGYIALFAYGWSEIFGQNIGLVLFIPGAIFEIVFPLWLIVKGFNEPAVTARSVK